MVIPTLAGGRRFRECLASLAAQQPGADALVVIDSGSQDGTQQAAQQAGARLLSIPAASFDHGLTRNRAVDELPDVDVIVFLVQDAVPVGSSWLALLCCAALADGVGAATARQRAPADAAPLTRATVERSPFASPGLRRVGPFAASELARMGPAGWRAALLLDDVACAVRAPLFRAVRFRQAAFGEDALLAYDLLGAGWALAHEPRAVVEHGHAYDASTVGPRYRQDACFFREHFGLRVRASPLSVLKGWLAEVAADRRWLAEHPTERAPGLMAASSSLRWAQVLAQYQGSRGPLGGPPPRQSVPRPEELAA